MVITLSSSCKHDEDRRDPYPNIELRNLTIQMNVQEIAPVPVPLSSQESRSLAPMALETQNAAEKAIYDLNVFLVHTTFGQGGTSPATPDVRFFYFDNVQGGRKEPITSPITLPNLYNGEYRLYAIANNGSKLYKGNLGVFSQCNLREDQIKNIQTTVNPECKLSAGLLMSTVMDPVKGAPVIDLRSTEQNDTYRYSMTLRRRVAKVRIKYAVKEELKGKIYVNYLKSQNIPEFITPFSENPNPAVTINMVKSDPVSENQYYETYILENNSGEVPAITVLNDRSAANAPDKASYAFLDCAYDNQNATTGYQIYFGNGQLSNFDLTGNHVYDMTININGYSANDSRVSTFYLKKVSVADDVDGGKIIKLAVSYSNQYKNRFRLQCRESIGGEVKNLEAIMIDATGNEIAIGDDGVPICNADLTNETDVQIKVKITYRGSGNVDFAVTDKYFRTSIVTQAV
ncbi:MAG: hypothetical protein RR980_02495 [Mucinivorans sp.]